MNTLKPVTVRTEQVETVPAAVKQKGTPAPAAAAAPKNAETKNTEAKNTGAENAETKNNAGTGNAASQTAGGKNVPQSALATAAPATTAKGNAVKENGTAEENAPKGNAVKGSGTAEENAVKGSGAPKETPKPAGRTSYVIVASLTSRADAEQEVKKLAKDGWPGAVVVESDGKFRVALSAHSQAGAAYQRVNELKKTERFRTAWVFTTN
ncbi:MAG: SPOR domain-containing protein [Bacteroidales bacterium]|nr:SPOR domain-containing protein [Bacteroidales bacterium]